MMCMADWDIHGYERWIERAYRQVRRSSIPAVNKQLILDFDQACVLEGLSVPRRAKLLRHMIDVSKEFLPIPFRRATKRDLQEAVVRIESRKGYSLYTKRDVKIAIKKFFKWVVYGDEYTSRDGYPPLVSWIKTSIKRKDLVRVQASDLLTVEEVESMVECMTSPRNKAFLAVLYELGARIGEIGGLRVGDVTRDEYSLLIDLDGKTGKRTVRVVLYAGHLVSWLNLHPGRQDPASPLWPSFCPRRYLQPLPYTELSMWIKDTARKVGIKKRIYPHLFRHSRATHLLASGKMNEAQAKAFFGWVPDSKVLSTYAHLVTKDANDAVLKMYGIRQADDLSSRLEAANCGMCEAANPLSAKLCHRCGYALGIREAEDARARKDDADDLLMRFLQRPDAKDIFKKMIREERHSDDKGGAPPRQAPPPGGPSGEEHSSSRQRRRSD